MNVPLRGTLRCMCRMLPIVNTMGYHVTLSSAAGICFQSASGNVVLHVVAGSFRYVAGLVENLFSSKLEFRLTVYEDWRKSKKALQQNIPRTVGVFDMARSFPETRHIAVQFISCCCKPAFSKYFPMPEKPKIISGIPRNPST